MEEFEGKVRTNGINIYARFLPKGDKTPVVLVMGLAFQMTTWPENLIELLQQNGYPVLLFDNRDIGLSEIIQHGISGVKAAKSFDDLFQYFAAAYTEVSFHQMGFMPSVHLATRSQLRKGTWCLDRYRSVQYVQNADQKAHLAKRLQGRKKQADPDGA